MNDTRRAVLDGLADGPVPGPDLADSLDVSRAAVWKHVEALRDAGFSIESGDDGYVLTDVPAYGGPAIEYGLDAPYEVEYHGTIGSTNDRARELATDGAADVVVVADEQTGGRGRLDREWAAPSGGGWLSLVVRPDLATGQAPVLTLAAAVAVTRAAREAGVDAGIKWPNDVLVTDEGGVERKLAGILTEMEGEADRVDWVVVGIGVNVNVDPADLATDAPATSVSERVGPVDRRAFVQRVLEEFAALVADPESIVPAWREYATTLGREVRVDTPGDVVEGTAVDVTYPGTLVVETDAGEERVLAGDCEHLRSA